MVKHKQFDLSEDEQTILMEFTDTEFWLIYGILAKEQDDIKGLLKFANTFPELRNVLDFEVEAEHYNNIESVLDLFDEAVAVKNGKIVYNDVFTCKDYITVEPKK